MSKKTTNLLKRRKAKETTNPAIKVKQLVANFQKHPAYALSRLKRANDQTLAATALALGAHYRQLEDGDESKAAMGQLIAYIRDLVAERRKVE